MKLIPLSKGQFAIVDDDIYDELIKFKWHAQNNKYGFYASSWITGTKQKRHMHRMVVNPTDDMMVDHINGDTLDNRKENLRECTNQQNQFNSRRSSNNTSGYKGVTFDRGRWKAQIIIKGVHTHLGYFDCPKKAHECYCQASSKHRGDFSNNG